MFTKLIIVTLLFGGLQSSADFVDPQEAEILAREVPVVSSELIEEIALAELPDFTLPEDISEVQIKKVFKQGDRYYATVIRQVFWYPLAVPNGGSEIKSGVITAKVGEEDWSWFMEIGAPDVPEGDYRNLPLYLWNDGSNFYVPIADGNGAGSGEGIVKLLKSSDQGQTWQTDSCYYAVGFDLNLYNRYSYSEHAERHDANPELADDKLLIDNGLNPGHGYFADRLELADPDCRNFTIN